MSKLKPCPFCGKKRHLRFEPFEGSTDTGIVVCICGASYTTIEQGADWNTRPIEDGLRAEIEALQKELDELKDLYRWHKIADDGLPELDQDVEIINMRTMEMQAGHFFDYNEGEPEPDIMFDDHNDTTFALSELPKKYQWRYLNAPKEGE
jgi:hypothetical protein